MKIHPAADSFPVMGQDRFLELKTDIEKRGQENLITLCDGMILDGRNRYRACLELGVEPQTREYVGNPWAYVWSMNGVRRDLSQDQRAQIFIFVNRNSREWDEAEQQAIEDANRKRSEAAKAQPRTETGFAGKQVVGQSVRTPEPERDRAKHLKASRAGVNPGAIARAEALASVRPDLAEQVRTGAIKPAEARRQAKRDEVKGKVSSIPDGQFTVVYADPPWSYNDKLSGDISEDYGAAEKHYPSMSLSELKALSIPAAPDSVLFLWSTSPMLPEALELSKAWGYRYAASFIWDKVLHNMGHYNSVRHEFLLISVRGSCTPQVTKLFDSVQSIERTKEHSEKPEQFRRIIETLYPNGAKLELFARKQVENWTTWGTEA